MSEKMMDEFKEWAYAASLDVWSASNGDGEPEYFMCYDTEICWQAWQASRAALVVELPGEIWCSLAYHEAINDVKEALDDAGAGYK